MSALRFLHNPTSALNTAKLETELETSASNKVFGFFIFLMSDCILFSVLFTTYIVFFQSSISSEYIGHTSFIGHASNFKLFNIPIVFIETVCLLSSSFTMGLSIIAMKSENQKKVLICLLITFALGLTFIVIEIYDFYNLISKGISPQQNAFLSSFFTLVGMHGLHVILGLSWIISIVFLITKQGMMILNQCRLLLLTLFWHFLDIIWVCIFSFIYLMGYSA